GHGLVLLGLGLDGLASLGPVVLGLVVGVLLGVVLGVLVAGLDGLAALALVCGVAVLGVLVALVAGVRALVGDGRPGSGEALGGVLGGLGTLGLLRLDLADGSDQSLGLVDLLNGRLGQREQFARGLPLVVERGFQRLIRHGGEV